MHGSRTSQPESPTFVPAPFSEARTALFQLKDGHRAPESLRDRYPLLKMGVHDGITWFAEKLAPVVEEIVAGVRANWVLAGPPFAFIPAAANLLAAATFERIRARPSLGARCCLREIEERPDGLSYADARSEDDYSRLSWHEREASRARSAHAAVPLEAFRGRAVLFVNDIRVTGAQERAMHGYFELVRPIHVHWLYVVALDEGLGRREPQIEHDLNQAGIGSFERVLRLLSAADLTFTSKAVATLLSYDPPDLRRLLAALPSERRGELWTLVRREPRYVGAHFAAKRTLLEIASAGRTTCSTS